MIASQVYAKARGSLAGTTARIVDGIMILSERIIKNSSKTIPQIFQRDKQKFVRTLADSVKIDIIDNFWFKTKPLTSGYSKFIGKNLLTQTPFDIPGTSFAPDKLALQFSEGSLEGIIYQGANTYKSNDGAAAIHWASTVSASGLDSDHIVIVIYQVNTFFPIIDTSMTRQEEELLKSIPEGLDVANLVYAIFAWREQNGKLLISPTTTISPTAI